MGITGWEKEREDETLGGKKHEIEAKEEARREQKARIGRMNKKWPNKERRRSAEGRRRDGARARFHSLPAPTNPEIPVKPAAAPLSSQPPASTSLRTFQIPSRSHYHNRLRAQTQQEVTQADTRWGNQQRLRDSPAPRCAHTRVKRMLTSYKLQACSTKQLFTEGTD